MKKYLFLAAIIIIVAIQTQAQSLTVTLTSSSYNGYSISCFGNQDGSITTTVSGGTPPYTYTWSTGDNFQNLYNLQAGYYRVRVKDANAIYVDKDITLDQPEAIKVVLTPLIYTVNGRQYNISLYGACNGEITTTVTGGVTPYSYNWAPNNSATANLSNVCADQYLLNVIDANGCGQRQQQPMTQPDRADWTMLGNANSNPATQYGTTRKTGGKFRERTGMVY